MPDHQVKAYEAAVDFHEARQAYAPALAFAQKLLPAASQYEKGRVLNRIAALHDQLGQPAEACGNSAEGC